MAMIWDRRRPILDGAARSNERKCRIIFLSRRLKGRKRAHAALEPNAARHRAAGDHFAVIEYENNSDLSYDSL
jgi:hypothetical protein